MCEVFQLLQILPVLCQSSIIAASDHQPAAGLQQVLAYTLMLFDEPERPDCQLDILQEYLDIVAMDWFTSSGSMWR